jgi:membrane-associated protease RseP (regulator of RpoE activity)
MPSRSFTLGKAFLGLAIVVFSAVVAYTFFLTELLLLWSWNPRGTNPWEPFFVFMVFYGLPGIVFVACALNGIGICKLAIWLGRRDSATKKSKTNLEF